MCATRRNLNPLLAGVLVAMLPSLALADYVPVGDPHPGELGHAAILEGVFSPGAPWTLLEDGVSWTNGDLSALRVDDFGIGGILDARSGQAGSATDQVWTGGPVTAQALARFAAYSQKFGYQLDGGSQKYINLFDVEGWGLDVAGAAVLELPEGATLAWARSGQGSAWFSDAARNGDQNDHLVTYQITGLSDGLKHWVLFWEDLPNLGDHDYNDLVVGLSAPLPEPASVLLLAAGSLIARCGRRR